MKGRDVQAFYVRFQLRYPTRAEYPAGIDRFMSEFIGFLETLGLGPTGDMAPSGQGVFLILGINPQSESVIVDVKATDPAAVETWFKGRSGVASEASVGPIMKIDIDANTNTRKATP